MNLCRRCGQVFGSVELFDRHRVGRHAYTFGVGMELGREDGRRCLEVDEMGERGWTLNGRGRWVDPARDPRGRLRESPELGKAVSA